MSSVDAEVDSNSASAGELSEVEGGPEGSQVSDASTEESISKPKARGPRRSTRVRRKPSWLSSGDFVVGNHSQQTQEKVGIGVDWEQKADFLAKLAMTEKFARIPDSFCQAILKLVVSGD